MCAHARSVCVSVCACMIYWVGRSSIHRDDSYLVTFDLYCKQHITLSAMHSRNPLNASRLCVFRHVVVRYFIFAPKNMNPIVSRPKTTLQSAVILWRLQSVRPAPSSQNRINADYYPTISPKSWWRRYEV